MASEFYDQQKYDEAEKLAAAIVKYGRPDKEAAFLKTNSRAQKRLSKLRIHFLMLDSVVRAEDHRDKRLSKMSGPLPSGGKKKDNKRVVWWRFNRIELLPNNNFKISQINLSNGLIISDIKKRASRRSARITGSRQRKNLRKAKES